MLQKTLVLMGMGRHTPVSVLQLLLDVVVGGGLETDLEVDL